MPIHIKAFANVKGLGEALQRAGSITNTINFRDFITGFNMRDELFDFIDVGSGKERADFKIRGTIRDIDSSHMPAVIC